MSLSSDGTVDGIKAPAEETGTARIGDRYNQDNRKPVKRQDRVS
jgi:hypothetical protein